MSKDLTDLTPVVEAQARKIKELQRIVRGNIRRMYWIQDRGPDILDEIADAWRDPDCPTFLDAVEDVMKAHGSRD